MQIFTRDAKGRLSGLFLLVAFATLAAAACGGDDTPAATATTAAAPEAAAPTPTSEPPAPTEVPEQTDAPEPTASPEPADGTAVSSTDHPTLGTVLTDSAGMTLYLFTNDGPGSSACSGGCAEAWPPLITDGEPVAEGNAEQGRLGTTEREDGTLQVTYNDRPLYHFGGDTAPGDANGHEVGGVWFAVDTAGDAAEAAVAAPPPTEVTLPGTAVTTGEHSTLGTILTDAAGMTLYLFTNDGPDSSSCSGGCADRWPPLITEGDPVAEGVAANNQLGTTEREDGSLQVTYNNRPLYHFAGDSAPGDANGHEVGGVWFAVGPDGEAAASAAPEPTPAPIAPTPTPTPPPTATPKPTATPVPTETPTPTATPEPTATPAAASAPAPEIVQVLIQNFELPNLNVQLGTTVIWRNADGTSHTASHGDSPAVAPSAEFRSPHLSRDGTYMHTFSQAGVFQYFCEIHPFMQATVTVTE